MTGLPNQKVMKTVYVSERQSWRQWLAEHHATETEIWFVYYKKHSRKPSLTYDEAVEEALCFGWIDSIVKRLDDDRYAQKFTPRKRTSAWSVPNRERVQRLLQAGRLTPAGLAKIPPDVLRGDPTTVPAPRATEWPAQLQVELQRHKQAWANYEQMAPSHQRNYIRWVTEAKKEETRVRRLTKAIAMMEANQTLSIG